MNSFLTSLLLTWLLLLLVSKAVDGVHFADWPHALLAALVLTAVNMLVRPLVVALTLPLTFLTLGLFLFVINALMFMLAAALAPGFTVTGFGPALLGSLLLSLLNLLVSRVFGI